MTLTHPATIKSRQCDYSVSISSNDNPLMKLPMLEVASHVSLEHLEMYMCRNLLNCFATIVCVCVSVKESEKEIETDRQTDREKSMRHIMT